MSEQPKTFTDEELLSQLPQSISKSLQQPPKVTNVAQTLVVASDEDESFSKKAQIMSELPEYMKIEHQQGELEKPFFRGAIWSKLMQNPLAVGGIGVTVVFFTKAVLGSVRNDAPMSINRNLRNRVKAQGFALTCIALGFLYTQQSRKNAAQQGGYGYSDNN